MPTAGIAIIANCPADVLETTIYSLHIVIRHITILSPLDGYMSPKNVGLDSYSRDD